MSSSASRHAYFISDAGLLFSSLSVRETRRRPWSEVGQPNWVLSIEQTQNGPKVTRGPAHTRRLEAEAILKEYAVPPPAKVDLGHLVPDGVKYKLMSALRRKVDRALRVIGRDWNHHATEMSIVGALISRISLSFEYDGWRASVQPQEFSSQIKEPFIGADIGWRIEIRKGDEATTKAMWMQAKRVDRSHVDPFALKDFEEQFTKMERRTSAAYGLVLSPFTAAVVDRRGTTSLEHAVSEAVECKRGDQSQEVLAETLDARYFVKVEVDGTPAP